MNKDMPTRAIMARICTSDSLGEAFDLYRLAAPLLPNCKFVFAAENGAAPGFAVNHKFSSGAVVRSLFKTDKVLVLDRDTVKEMESGGATYPIDYSISLDTQALSYLEPYLAGRSSGIPKDFKEVFDFIARDDVFVDPTPYLCENLHNLDDRKAADRVFGKLKAYETLRTLDSQWLKTTGKACSTLTESELDKRAQELIARMYMDRANEGFMRALNFRQQFMYCHLLKMASIQLQTPQASVIEKIERFVEFCDCDLATISGRETALARAYFELGHNLTFFGKVQKKKPDLFKTLDGMAWDLWHVRQLEETMTLKPSRQARYFFPALLTFDKRLVEIIDLYPLKACAYIEGEHEPMPFYDGDWFQLVAGDDQAQARFAERFYSVEARSSRELRRNSVKAQFEKIVTALENELCVISSVEKLAS
ncbi:hypothetical protein DLM_0340 [Aquitalea magnusonii]|uniref:Uncharacterized protein n=1 Tax=Aquitalea magnusonii TaxID=332411 RepID=A0A3G9GD38_9NEIS|nr:hypothetical protein [Aquitalea magnusonii]BBF84012.1 hypothetical protein DLM_0340 [Aquitalea magnusonii]